jgi:lysophospholipase L1-like esterase
MNLRPQIRILIIAVFAAACLTVSADAQQKWVGSWAASQQLVEPHNSIAADDLTDVTLRQVVHLTIGGNELRLHLSNRYGVTPLHIEAVHLARVVAADSSKIVPGSDQPLIFSGAPDVIIPPGADYVSDPIAYSSPAFSDLAITIHVQSVPAAQTGHPGSRATSYLVHGNQVSAMELAGAKKIEHWYFIAGIDALADEQATAVATLGDSITDGHGATTNGNDRWPDVLARRLQASDKTAFVAVLNHGIGGNRIMTDDIGPNAMSRFDHDVLAQAGVHYLLVLEGINDLGMFTRAGDHSPAEHRQFVNAVVTAYQMNILKKKRDPFTRVEVDAAFGAAAQSAWRLRAAQQHHAENGYFAAAEVERLQPVFIL